MFVGQLLPRWDAQNRYGATDFDWIDHANMNYSRLKGGPSEVNFHTVADHVYEKVSPFLNEIITKAAEIITTSLYFLGLWMHRNTNFDKSSLTENRY